LSSERQKPVKLQVNTFGSAWRDVVRFDAANDVTSMEVMDAAERLGRLDGSRRTKFRIATDDVNARYDVIPSVLTHWTAERGWKES